MVSEFELIPEGGWAGAGTARLVAPRPADRGLAFVGLSKLAKRFGRRQVPEIFAVMHINARLFWAWLLFASRLMPGGRLPARVREKCILRTAWNCRSRYEWGQHVTIALAAGLGDDDILAVSRGPSAFETAHDRALIQACDDICHEQCVSDDVWHGLCQHYDAKRRIELVMLIGHYRMIAGFLNSAGIALEPAIESQLQALHRRLAGRGDNATGVDPGGQPG